jgi:hypothetical protein
MRHRTTLFAGVALAVTGAVLLIAGNDPATRDTLVAATRLWPALLIAIGVVLLARRARLAVVATLAAALMAGLVVGGAALATPDLKADCPDGRADATETRNGTFDGAGSLELVFSCGDLDVSTAPGTAWRLDSLPLGDDRAVVVQDGDRLTVRSSHEGWALERRAFGDAWRLTLPTGTPLDIDGEINAADADLDLTGLQLGDLDLEVNAGDLRLDLGSARLDVLDLEVNAGRAVVSLPSGNDLTGSIRASAGKVELCVPAGLGLRVTSDVALGDVDHQGLVRVGDTWQTPDLSSTTHVADLSIEATAASVVIDPEGGCK